MNKQLKTPTSRFESFLATGKAAIQSMYGIDFSDDVWQLPADRIGAKHAKRFVFSSFPSPFKELFKAIVANTCASRDGRGSLARSVFLDTAKMFIPHILGIQNIHDIGIDHFHQAVKSIRERIPPYAPTTMFSMGQTLGQIANELDSHHFTTCRIGFKSPFPKADIGNYCGEHSCNRKREKLPDPRAITALGEVYREIMNGADNDQDRILACASVLLCCTGFRINELLTLPVDSWRENQFVDDEGRIITATQLGYAPEKGGTSNAMARWIAPSLVGLAKEAFDQIVRITEPFRENARMLARGEVNLPDLDGNRIYNLADAARILGYSARASYNTFKECPVLTIKKRDGSRYRITPQAIRNLVVSVSLQKPVQEYPWRQELHESLFVVSHKFYHNPRGMNGTATLLDDGTFSNFLCGRKEWKQRSCFERFGKLNPDNGKPWRIPSHGFRHMLNTLFQIGGFTQEDIASYFGRRDTRVNMDYNHMTRKERLAVATAAYEGGELVGPLREALDGIKDPIRRNLAMTASFRNTQLSPLGICFHHDGSEIPTIPDRCAVCPGLAVIKGHPDLIEETRRQLEVAERTLAAFNEGLAEGFIQDGPWIPLANERRERLRTILSMHVDAAIPDGRVIQLGNPKRKRDLCATQTI